MDEDNSDLSEQILVQQSMIKAQQAPTFQSPSKSLSRQLGLLETMYHTYNCREIDVSPLSFKLSCRSRVMGRHIKQALFLLTEEYPSLRLTVVQTGHFNYKFVEKKHIPVSIHEITEKSFEVVLNKGCHHKFDFRHGPLWKFTKIKGPDNTTGSKDFPHSFHFFFIFHHAICDFHQGRSMVGSFIRNIAFAQGALSSVHVSRRFLCPSIENVIPLHLVNKNLNFNQQTQWPNCAIDAYNTAYAQEISSLSKEKVSTHFATHRLNETDTRILFSLCAYHGVKITSALISAMTLSFLHLVKSSISNDSENFVVPVELMVDMTRYIVDNKLRQDFGSVAAIHLPFCVNTNLSDLKTNLKQGFWSLAKECQNMLSKDLAKGDPMKVLLQDVCGEICNKPETGKSPFVLSFSNMGSLDAVVPENCKNEMRIDDFLPWTNVAIDDMPIFNTGFYTIRNSLHIIIGFCTSYTSKQTTDMFVKYLTHLIQSSSKL